MMTNFSQENWQFKVRNNEENDRIDEGDFPGKGKFHMEVSAPLDQQFSVYDVYEGDNLVAKVRGQNADNRMVIPLRELSDDEEDELYQYLDGDLS